MSKQAVDIPEGYRMTEFGPLPEDWQVSTIGNLFDIHQGKALSPKSRTGKCPHPFLRTANVLWGRVGLSVLDQMDFSDQEVERLSLAPGDLLVCEGGDIGRTAMWRGEVQRCCYQNHVHRLRARSPEVTPEFYMYWMQAAILLLGRYRGAGNKTTIPNLSQSRLSRFEVPLPPLPEQKKIAAVLSTVQQAKEKTEAVIAALRELKKSLMKHLFTYGPVPVDEAENIRLKETEVGMVPEEWEVVSLGDVCQFFQYGTSQRCTAAGDGRPVLRIPNVIDGKVNISDLKFTRLPKEASERIRLAPGDLLFVRTNGRREYVGRCAVFRGEVDGALFASYLIRARLLEDRALPEFAKSYTMTAIGREWLSGRASGAADGKFNINTQILKSAMLPLPPVSEQQRIVSMLRVADDRIKAATDGRNALDQIFRTLLNDLMTARIRVNDLEVGA